MPVAFQIVGNSREHFRPQERIDEGGGADLDSSRASDQELERVVGIVIPPMPMIGILTTCRHS